MRYTCNCGAEYILVDHSNPPDDLLWYWEGMYWANWDINIFSWLGREKGAYCLDCDERLP